MLSVTGVLLSLLALTAATPTFGSSGTKNCTKVIPPPKSAGKLAHVGVNIAGFDFGCGTDGVYYTLRPGVSQVCLIYSLTSRLALLLQPGRH
jgi:hypothetical protein